MDLKFQSARIERIDKVILTLQNIKAGAFRPFFDNPIFAGFFIPVGGLGSLKLFEYLLK
jgi:hypothetical protein